ncbi:EGF-like domain-containing protein [Plasmodiophora brassicae]|uniref:EGF-like domain-containing protein n=1 Tax=Plasmodiophora brassicae TaxID=37360 RepID=A0A0G4J1N7_PLABS|nr:hypothetical protein PBRA_001845 [Plasmodiophora brassicae]SPR01280.1 unnamed protein product [Plasmodiophora brassicae]
MSNCVYAILLLVACTASALGQYVDMRVPASWAVCHPVAPGETCESACTASPSCNGFYVDPTDSCSCRFIGAPVCLLPGIEVTPGTETISARIRASANIALPERVEYDAFVLKMSAPAPSSVFVDLEGTVTCADVCASGKVLPDCVLSQEISYEAEGTATSACWLFPASAWDQLHSLKQIDGTASGDVRRTAITTIATDRWTPPRLDRCAAHLASSKIEPHALGESDRPPMKTAEIKVADSVPPVDDEDTSHSRTFQPLGNMTTVEQVVLLSGCIVFLLFLSGAIAAACIAKRRRRHGARDPCRCHQCHPPAIHHPKNVTHEIP